MLQCLKARNERFLWRSGGSAHGGSKRFSVSHRRHFLSLGSPVGDSYCVIETAVKNWEARTFSAFCGQRVTGAASFFSPALQMRLQQSYYMRTLGPSPTLSLVGSEPKKNVFSVPPRSFSSTPLKQEEGETTDRTARQPQTAPSTMPSQPGKNSIDANVGNNAFSVVDDGLEQEGGSNPTSESHTKSLKPTLIGAVTRSKSCPSHVQDLTTVGSESPKHLMGSSSTLRHATRLAFASIPGGAYAVMQQQYSLTRHLAQRYGAWKTRRRLLKEKNAAMKTNDGVEVSSTSSTPDIADNPEGRNSEPLQQHWVAYGRRSARKRSRLPQRQENSDIQGTPILTSPPVKVLPHLVSETVLQSQRAQQKFQQTGGSSGASGSPVLTSSDLPPLSSKTLRKEYSDGASTQRASTNQGGSLTPAPLASIPQPGTLLRKSKDDQDLFPKSTTFSEATSPTPTPSKASPATTLHVVDDTPELMRHYEAVLQTILAAGTVEKKEKHFLAEYRKRCHITEDMHLEALKRLGWERAEFEAGSLFSHAQKQPYWRQLLMRGLDICEEKGNYIVTLGSVASLTSIMMPNMLHLRCLQIIAGSLHFLFNVTRRPPLTSAAYWNLVFFVINGFMLLKLFLEHRPETFSESELDMFERYFLNTGLSPRQFKKLLSLATWKTIPANEVLVEQGQPVTQLSILYRGQLKVLVNGSEVETLREGDSNAIIGLKCFLSRLYENSTPLASDGRDDNGAQQQLQQGMLRSLLGIAPAESGDEGGDTLSVDEGTLSKVSSVQTEKNEKLPPPHWEGQFRELPASTATSEDAKVAEHEPVSRAPALVGTSSSSTEKEKVSFLHSREPGVRERTLASSAALAGGKTAIAPPTGVQDTTETNKTSLASTSSPWGDSRTMASSTTVIATEDAILLAWSMDELLSRVKADPVNIGLPLVGGMARSLVARSRNQSAKQNLTSYQAVMQAILSDGEARPEEKTFLSECRQKFGIPEEHHWIILERLGWTRAEFEDGAKHGVVRQPATRAIRAVLSVVKEQLKRAGTNGIQLSQPESTAEPPPASVQP